MAKPTLLTLDEAAARLTIARKTLRDWLKAKPPKIPGVKIGREWRVLEADVEAYLARAIGARPHLAPEPEASAQRPRLVVAAVEDAHDPPPLPVVPTPQQHKALTGLRAQIVDVLRAHPEGLTPAQVKGELGTNKDLRNTMKNMLQDGILRRPETGTYAVYVVADGW
jgi:excisionase family DNA binding protein